MAQQNTSTFFLARWLQSHEKFQFPDTHLQLPVISCCGVGWGGDSTKPVAFSAAWFYFVLVAPLLELVLCVWWIRWGGVDHSWIWYPHFFAITCRWPREPSPLELCSLSATALNVVIWWQGRKEHFQEFILFFWGRFLMKTTQFPQRRDSFPEILGRLKARRDVFPHVRFAPSLVDVILDL